MRSIYEIIVAALNVGILPRCTLLSKDKKWA